MEQRSSLALAALAGAVICGAWAQVAAAQASPQNPNGSTARDYVLIGCIGHDARDGAERGLSTYVITDSRATPKASYRLDGAAEQLQLHVGHMVEVTGPIVAAGSGQPGASMPTLKVRSLTYISTSCGK